MKELKKVNMFCSICEEIHEVSLIEEEKETIKKQGGYKRTIEKAHGQIEIREYYQTENIRWIGKKKDWKGLKSIGMEEKTIQSEEGERKEYRYYISS